MAAGVSPLPLAIGSDRGRPCPTPQNIRTEYLRGKGYSANIGLTSANLSIFRAILVLSLSQNIFCMTPQRSPCAAHHHLVRGLCENYVKSVCPRRSPAAVARLFARGCNVLQVPTAVPMISPALTRGGAFYVFSVCPQRSSRRSTAPR